MELHELIRVLLNELLGSVVVVHQVTTEVLWLITIGIVWAPRPVKPGLIRAPWIPHEQ